MMSFLGLREKLQPILSFVSKATSILTLHNPLLCQVLQVMVYGLSKDKTFWLIPPVYQ
jgi:hypothetical protein